MGLFSPKKVYHIEWSYESSWDFRYTEFIKAKDWYRAWNKVRKRHSLPIFARKIEEVK